MPLVTTDAPTPPSGSARPPLAPATWWGRPVVLLGLAAGVAYLVWRWGWTLDGASPWIALPLVVAETYALVTLTLLVFSAWRRTERPVRPPLAGREVAVLIATFDEDPDVLRPTVVGALAIRHDVPHRVWVLDDGGRPWVARM
jgi:cellulose synthase (UDP-forming)